MKLSLAGIFSQSIPTIDPLTLTLTLTVTSTLTLM